MTRKLRFLERVHASRKRMRDVAAATAATANDRQRQSLDRLTTASQELSHTLGNAADRLQNVDTITRLWEYEQEIAALREITTHAEAELEQARGVAASATGRLTDRERELRSTEKHLDRLKSAIDRSERVAEQKSSDDLSATRFKRTA